MKYIRKDDTVEEVTYSEIEASENLGDLENRIYDAAKSVMMSPEFGFPEDEVDDYLFVETEPSYLGDGSPATRIEVRAEVSYDGMRKIAESLDKIVKEYDPDAYFDDVDSGIIEAFVEENAVDSCTSVSASLVEVPQDVIDELLSILDHYGFTLDTTFEVNPGKTWMGDPHIQVVNLDSSSDGSMQSIRQYVTRDLVDEIHELSGRSNCPITWSFGVNEDGQVTGGLTIDKKYVPDDVESAQKILTSLNCMNEVISSSSEDDYKEFFDLQDQVYQELSKIGGDLDDFQGDIRHSDYLEDELVLSFDSYIEKKSSKYAKLVEKTLKTFFETKTRFNDSVEVDCYISKNVPDPSLLGLGYHVDVHAFAGSKNVESCQDSVESASYGGAFDIEDDMYFTKDDIVEFGNEVAEQFSIWAADTYELSDVYMNNPKSLHLEVSNGDIELYADIEIDMRKIRYPRDIEKYTDKVLFELKSSYNDYFGEDEGYEQLVDDIDSCTNSTNIASAEYVPDRQLDPDEGPVDEIPAFKESIDVDINTIVDIDEYGYWVESDDAEQAWAEGPDQTDWYSEEYTDVFVASAEDVIHDCYQMMETMLPGAPGTYKLTGKAHLVYEVDDLVYYPDIDVYKTDGVDVTLLPAESKIEDFKFEKLK